MGKTDYQALCQELFGTTDIETLRQIAAGVRRGNPRNAGRKQMFSAQAVRDMEERLAQGVPVSQIAQENHTSAQVIGRYLNRHPGGNYTLRIHYMHGNRICTIIDVDFLDEKIRIQNRTAHPLRRAFGVNENPDWEDFWQFLRDRCIPESRGYVKSILRGLGTSGYDPLEIAEAVQGRTAEDNMWMQFHYYPKGVNDREKD